MANIYTSSRPVAPPVSGQAPPIKQGGTPPPIIKGVPNPMTQIASTVRNSLFGSGSLGTNNAHIGSIQNNIARAISVSKEFSNTPAIESLLAAQASMTAASSAKDSASRNAALASAKQSLIIANNAMSSLGYGKAIGQVVPNANSRVL